MRIAVAGIGYVGLSMAVLLAQHNTVIAVDVVSEKVDMINNRKSPIADKDIEQYLSEKQLDLTATTNGDDAYKDAEFIIICTPTNYDTDMNYFDTSTVENIIQQVIDVNPDAFIIIKSTLPVGFTEMEGPSIAVIIFYSVLNFCVRDMPCMITSTQAASLSGPRSKMPD